MSDGTSSVGHRSESVIRELLSHADVTIGGANPQDITVHDPSFYDQVLRDGSLGLGESYMDGKWDANNLRVFIEHVLRADLQQHVKYSWHTIFTYLQALFINRQSVDRARQVGKQHYDLSGILPEKLLDPYNQYSCAYFRDGGETIAEAEEKKLDLICRKLQLQKGERLLDIGCGWGGLSKYAAEKYGCSVTGVSISHEQVVYAREFCKGLPVEILEQDYRNLSGTFDKVVSVGMIEHVGPKNYRSLFQIAHDCLKHDGLFLLHTIGNNSSDVVTEAFIDKYIFPNGVIPSMPQLDKAREGLFVLQDFQNLGRHYGPTLEAWHRNLIKNWPSVADKYDERFRRMFEYYLLSCSGAFYAGNLQLWQQVFTKPKYVIDYRGPR